MPDNKEVAKQDWFKGRLDNSIEYKTLGTDDAEFKGRDAYWEDEAVKADFMEGTNGDENEAKYNFNATYDQLSKERAEIEVDKLNYKHSQQARLDVNVGLSKYMGGKERSIDDMFSYSIRDRLDDGSVELGNGMYSNRTRDHREGAALSGKVLLGGKIIDVPKLDTFKDDYLAWDKMGLMEDDAVALKSMLNNPDFVDEKGNMITHYRYSPASGPKSRGVDYIEAVGELKYSDDLDNNDFYKHKNDEIVSFYDYADKDAQDIEAGLLDFIPRTINNTGVGFMEAAANLRLGMAGIVGADDEFISGIMNDLKTWEGGKVTTALETQEAGFFSVDNIMEQVLNIAVQLGTGRLAAKTAFSLASLATSNAAILGNVAKYSSSAVMSATAIKDSYKEAINNGYNSKEAGYITLATFGAMMGATSISSIPTSNINKMLKSKQYTSLLKSSMSYTDDMISGVKNNADKLGKISAMTKRVKDATNSMLTRMNKHEYLGAAMEEGFEEVTELAAEEAVKNLANAYSAVYKDDPKVGKGRYKGVFDEGYWGEKMVEGLMSFSMGALGGTMAKGGSALWNSTKKTEEGAKREPSDYMNVILLGKEKEFLESLDKRHKAGKFGSLEYSTEWNKETGTYKRMADFQEGEESISMGEANKNIVLHQFNMTKTLANSLGSTKAIDSFLEVNKEFKDIINHTTIASDLVKLTDNYVKLITSIDGAEDALITPMPEGIQGEDKAKWLDLEAKKSNLSVDDIEQLSTIKAQVKDISSGKAAGKYLDQAITKGTPLDPESEEGKSYPFGKDFYHKLMTESNTAAETMEAVKLALASTVKENDTNIGSIDKDLSNIDDILGNVIVDNKTNLTEKGLQSLQKLYDGFKLDEKTVVEVTKEVSNSGILDKAYSLANLESSTESEKEAMFMEQFYKKYYNEQLSKAKTPADLESLKFFAPQGITQLESELAGQGFDDMADITEAINSSDTPGALVDQYYDRIVNHPASDMILEGDGDVLAESDTIQESLDKRLGSFNKLKNYLTSAKNSELADTEYDPTDVDFLLNGFGKDGNNIKTDGSLLTKINELLTQRKSQTIGTTGESMFNNVNDSRALSLQTKARIAQLDTIIKRIDTDKGNGIGGAAIDIGSFMARKEGISKGNLSSADVMDIMVTAEKNGEFTQLFNKSEINPLEYFLLKNKPEGTLTPEEKAKLDQHTKTIDNLASVRSTLQEISEKADELVVSAEAGSKSENIEGFRKKDLAASASRSSNVLTGMIDLAGIVIGDHPVLVEFNKWASGFSKLSVDDDALIEAGKNLQVAREYLGGILTDGQRVDLMEGLRDTGFSSNEVVDAFEFMNPFYNSISVKLADTTKSVPVAEQMEAAAFVYSRLMSNVQDEVYKVFNENISKTSSDTAIATIITGIQGSGKTSVVLGYGVKIAQEQQEKILGKNKAKVLLASQSANQVKGLIESAEKSGIDIKKINNEKGIKSTLTKGKGYELNNLRDVLAANKGIDDVTTIVIDEIGLNQYGNNKKAIKDRTSLEQVMYFTNEINKKRGPNNQLKLVLLGDGAQNTHKDGSIFTHNNTGSTSKRLTTNHRSNIASLVKTTQTLNTLAATASGEYRISTTHGPVEGRTDGLMAGVSYNQNMDKFDSQELSDDIEKHIKLRSDAGEDVFTVALLLDDVSKFKKGSKLGKLLDKYPANIQLKSHEEFQGGEADYVVASVSPLSGETPREFFNKTSTTIGRARLYAVINDTSNHLEVKSTLVDGITMTKVVDASAAIRPLMIDMFAALDGKVETAPVVETKPEVIKPAVVKDTNRDSDLLAATTEEDVTDTFTPSDGHVYRDQGDKGLLDALTLGKLRASKDNSFQEVWYANGVKGLTKVINWATRNSDVKVITIAEVPKESITTKVPGKGKWNETDFATTDLVAVTDASFYRFNEDETITKITISKEDLDRINTKYGVDTDGRLALQDIPDALLGDLVELLPDTLKDKEFDNDQDRESYIHANAKIVDIDEYNNIISKYKAASAILNDKATPAEKIMAELTEVGYDYSDELITSIEVILGKVANDEHVVSSPLSDLVLNYRSKYVSDNSGDGKDTKSEDEILEDLVENHGEITDTIEELEEELKNGDEESTKDTMDKLIIAKSSVIDNSLSSEQTISTLKSMELSAADAMLNREKLGFVTGYATHSKGLVKEKTILKYTIGEGTIVDNKNYMQTKLDAMYPDEHPGRFTYSLIGRTIFGSDGNGGRTEYKDLVLVAADKNRGGKSVVVSGMFAMDMMTAGNPDVEAFKTSYLNATIKAKGKLGGFFNIKVNNPEAFLETLSAGKISKKKGKFTETNESLSDFRKKDNKGVTFSKEVIISTKATVMIDGVAVENPHLGDSFIIYSRNPSQVSTKAVNKMVKDGIPSNGNGLPGVAGGVGILRLDARAQSFDSLYSTYVNVLSSEAQTLSTIVTNNIMQVKFANAFADLGAMVLKEENADISDRVTNFLDLSEKNTFTDSSSEVSKIIETTKEYDTNTYNTIVDVMNGMLSEENLGTEVEGKVVETKSGSRPLVVNDSVGPLTVFIDSENNPHTRFDMGKFFNTVSNMADFNKADPIEVMKVLDTIFRESHQFSNGILIKPIIESLHSKSKMVAVAAYYPGLEDNLSINVDEIGLPSTLLEAVDLTSLLDRYVNESDKPKTNTTRTKKPSRATVAANLKKEIEVASEDELHALSDKIELLHGAKGLTDPGFNKLNDLINNRLDALEVTPDDNDMDDADLNEESIELKENVDDVSDIMESASVLVLSMEDVDAIEIMSKDIRQEIRLNAAMGTPKNVIDSLTSKLDNVVTRAKALLSADPDDIRTRITEAMADEIPEIMLNNYPGMLLKDYHIAKNNGDDAKVLEIEERINNTYFKAPKSDSDIAIDNIVNTPETSIIQISEKIATAKEMLADGSISKERYKTVIDTIKSRFAQTEEYMKVAQAIADGDVSNIDTSSIVDENIKTLIDQSQEKNISDDVSPEAKAIIEESWAELKNVLDLPVTNNAALIPVSALDNMINIADAKFNAYIGFIVDPYKAKELIAEFDQVKTDVTERVNTAHEQLKNMSSNSTVSSMDNLIPEFNNSDNAIALSDSDKEVIFKLSDDSKSLFIHFLNNTSADKLKDLGDLMWDIEDAAGDDYDLSKIQEYMADKQYDTVCGSK